MRMIFKVSFYVRSNYENKSGKSPLMIRIYLNKEMLNVGSSGIYVDKKLWCNSTMMSLINIISNKDVSIEEYKLNSVLVCFLNSIVLILLTNLFFAKVGICE